MHLVGRQYFYIFYIFRGNVLYTGAVCIWQDFMCLAPGHYVSVFGQTQMVQSYTELTLLEQAFQQCKALFGGHKMQYGMATAAKWQAAMSVRQWMEGHLPVPSEIVKGSFICFWNFNLEIIWKCLFYFCWIYIFVSCLHYSIPGCSQSKTVPPNHVYKHSAKALLGNLSLQL